jgi:hypothetical protein
MSLVRVDRYCQTADILPSTPARASDLAHHPARQFMVARMLLQAAANVSNGGAHR